MMIMTITITGRLQQQTHIIRIRISNVKPTVTSLCISEGYREWKTPLKILTYHSF